MISHFEFKKKATQNKNYYCRIIALSILITEVLKSTKQHEF